MTIAVPHGGVPDVARERGSAKERRVPKVETVALRRTASTCVWAGTALTVVLGWKLGEYVEKVLPQPEATVITKKVEDWYALPVGALQAEFERTRDPMERDILEGLIRAKGARE